MRKNYIVGFFICAALSIALLYLSNKDPSIEQKIASIPQKERVVLEDFFKFLYAEGCFVDVIYGDKPMASVDYNVYYTLNVNKNEAYKKNMQLCLEGWKIWKKYSDQFPMKKFYLFSKKYSNGDQCYCFVLANKDRCQEIISKYPEVYDTLHSQNKNPIPLIENLSVAKDEITKNKSNYHKALGLLYGYGLSNVNNFIKKIALEEELSLLTKSNNSTKSAIRKELDTLQKTLTFIKVSKSRDYPIQHSGCITLDPDNKIVKLNKTSEELVEILNSDNFLQTILIKLSN